MTNLIVLESKRVAKEIYIGVGRFEILITLQTKLEKELLPYKTEETKLDFLNHLEKEASEQFRNHLVKCKDILNCPKHKTYKNLEFLLQQERNQLMYENLFRR